MKHHSRYSNRIIIGLFWILCCFSLAAHSVTTQIRVSANNDDAEERVSDGDMYRDSSDLEFGYDDFVGGLQTVGMRFRSVDIPQGATINSAYIEFVVDETDSGTTNLVIYGEDADSPNQFANNDDNISDRTKTSAFVNWAPSSWNSVNDLHQTPDIAAIIQEIVNRTGWAENNNLVMMVEPGSGCNSLSCQRTAEAYDGDPDEAPLLVVDYTVAGSGGSNLIGSMNVDNNFIAYISTDDSVAGTQIGSGNNWPTTVDIATTLTAGQDYYLHVYATDSGGVAGFLGDFEITGGDHTFSNSTTTLNTNTAHWSVSTSGWSNYQGASSYGVNGVSPWGNRSGVDASAEWIWSSDNNGDNVNYFTATISAASPTPPGSCAPYFPDVAQGNTDSSYIRFRNTTRLIDEPDNIISFPSITDQASGFTCTTADCTATSSAAPALTLPDFETTSTNSDFSRSSGTSTIGTGGTYNSNEVDELTLNGSANATFLQSSDKYIISEGRFTGSAVVTFNEGEYWFDFLEILDSVQIIVNGPVTIFVNDHFDIEGTSRVNVDGPAKNLAIVGYDKFHIKDSAEVHAVIYNDGGEEVKFQDTSKVFGAVSASGKLELKDSATITYEDISDVAIGDLCGDDSLELQDVSTSCASLQEITVIFNGDVEQSSAETVGNYQVTNPSGVDITINSATRGPDNTVVLDLASSLNDLTEYTVTINNVENLSGNVIAAGTTSSFGLSCSLNCISDTFSGPGDLSSSWSASSSNGSFGAPRIVEDGRLRLTDNTGRVATVATLLNQFPGADNKLVIEFDYYGYDGNGADGVAVTFSDASILPVPGSYGGALGYAQRDDGTPGFAGGWLGVGIDEYGNFANSNEGKDGGSGFERDSVALRGSGSDVNGYPYLTSTGSLTPGVDDSGSTPNPGHRYRISIDHTMGGSEAYVSVERDTGAGFVEIIPRFDVFTVNPSQTAVPTNWIVSLTGSTGGNTNIHEIGEFEVCAALPISPYGSPDHYEISHTSPGVTCEGSEVTITAHDASNNLFTVNRDTDITVTTTPAVDNIISSPVTMLSGTSSVSFYLNQSDALANIDIDVTDGTASDLDDGGSEDEPFDFLDTAFRFYANSSNTGTTPIGTQISGKPSNISPGDQNLTLRAVRTNTDTGACEAALEGTTSVELAYECNNPTSCTASNLLSLTGASTSTISRNGDGASLAYASVDMLFDANGEAPFSFNYADAGQITLHARKSVAANDPDPAFELIGQSNEFVVRPFAFHFEVEDEPTTSSGAGSVYRKAGENFDVTLRAVLYESGDDASNNTDLANNGLTPNFGGHSSLALDLGFSLQAPTGAGTSAGSLQSWSNQSVGFNNTSNPGERLFTSLNWSEVGVISMNADHSNYLGSGQAISGSRPNIGRFYPDHFDVVVDSGRFDSSCGSFTYIGQDFTYEPLQVPSLAITAKNSIGAGGTTVNYTDTDFMKLDVLGVTRVFPVTDTQLGSDNLALMSVETNLLAGTGEALSVDGAGVMTYSFDAADLYRYTKNANSEIGPFDSSLSITVSEVKDGDDVVNGALISDVTPLAPTGSANDSNVYGRFVMQNAFGPETDNLAMGANTEFLNAAGQYVVNTSDNCTNLVSTITLNPSGTAGAENHDAIPVGSGTSDFSYNSSLSAGDAGFLFTAPGAGNNGEIDVTTDLLTLPWLQYNWDNSVDGSLENHPSVKATFGQYRGHDRVIYWREVQ